MHCAEVGLPSTLPASVCTSGVVHEGEALMMYVFYQHYLTIIFIHDLWGGGSPWNIKTCTQNLSWFCCFKSHPLYLWLCTEHPPKPLQFIQVTCIMFVCYINSIVSRYSNEMWSYLVKVTDYIWIRESHHKYRLIRRRIVDCVVVWTEEKYAFFF